MIALAIVLSYLVVGFFAGKRAFAARLGTSPRRKKDSYLESSFSMTDAYESASIWGVVTFLFWPLALPAAQIVLGETPHERSVKLEKEARELESKISKLEKEILAYGEQRR